MPLGIRKKRSSYSLRSWKSCVPDCHYSSQRHKYPLRRKRNCSRAHKQLLLDHYMRFQEEQCHLCFQWHHEQHWRLNSLERQKQIMLLRTFGFYYNNQGCHAVHVLQKTNKNLSESEFWVFVFLDWPGFKNVFLKPKTFALHVVLHIWLNVNLNFELCHFREVVLVVLLLK